MLVRQLQLTISGIIFRQVGAGVQMLTTPEGSSLFGKYFGLGPD